MRKHLSGKNVLLVDDMSVVRVLVGDYLRAGNAHPIEASNGLDALKIIEDQPVDAFLIDIQMPGMNGIELCRRIRQMDRHRNTPVLFISSLDESEFLEEALEAGGDDFIGKPVQRPVLWARLRNLLQRAELLESERLVRLSLQRYMSPQTEQSARAFAKTGVLPPPKKMDVCVLFSDVRGFSELSQEMNPEALLAALGDLLSNQVSLVYKHGGYVDKFAGDGLMAIFDGPDRTVRGCACALDMVEASAVRLEKDGIRIHQMGIGLHSGEVITGNLGSTEHLDFTAVGPTVNLAARLCGMADSLSVLVSNTVRLELRGQRGFHFENERLAAIRGFREKVGVSNLIRAAPLRVADS